MGKLTVLSALGQVLNAEIDLVSLQPGELDSLTARVAAPEAFRDARIEYAPSLRLLRFSVEKRPTGQPYLKVTSVAPINEPFVDVLIEVTWPAGRIQREYPILLDPPGYSQSRVTAPAGAAAPASRVPDAPPATAPAAASSTPSSASTAPATVPGGPSARAELASTAPGAPRETPASGDTYGPIQKGETLRKIAEETKPSDVSLEQMLVALYRSNQSAFVNNNMNRLKAGQILKVPNAAEVAQIERKEANQEIRTQVADWRAYREQLAGGVASIPARADSTNVASGRVASAAVTPPAPPSAEPKDVLKLSKSDAGKAGAGKGAGGGQERLNALQEEVTSKDKALRESQSRVADLEKQIRDMQRLLDLKGGAPAKADSKIATAPVPVPVPAPAPAPAKVEAPKVEPPKPADLKTLDPPKPADTKLADATRPADAAKPMEPPKVDAAKPSDPPKVAQAPKTDVKATPRKVPVEKSFTDELLENPWYLMAGIGGLAALGIGGFLFARRRKDRAEAGPSSSMTSAFPSDLKPDSTTGKSGGGLVDTGNSSFLTDFDKTGPGSVDTDEVDPVAEAEVYIAYGRDAQAEEILKEAMARDKGRHEIPLKLLEIYHARKSATAFETVAKELRANVGEGSPLWQKAAAMGAQIDPTNPLYGGAGGSTATYAAMAPAAAHAKPDVDFDLEGSSNAAPAPDFDLDIEGKKGEAASSDGMGGTSSGIDFDASSAPASHASTPAKEEEKHSFDFDLSGLDFPGSGKPGGSADLELDPTRPAANPSAASTASGLDLADLSLDSPGDSGGGEGVATKLELAKAYLEIGDKDGARDILQEVAKEGSSAQKEEAQKLIASL
ncbi:MAG: LPXTG cell wall anchor domain-containing protein [Pseudomonadota bacterium]|nr:LPXTG cell wall anchor domain-containing protein [Pseudomonadota bacterium]